MIVFLTMLGVLCAAAAGILIYRWGVCDGMTICKRAGRTAATAVRRERTRSEQSDEQLTKQLQEMVNFMQYDGGEMPRVDGGVS